MTIKKVLVSQPKPASEKSPYYEIAEKYGVKIDFRPFIKVESLTAKEFRQQRVSILDYTAIVFTSRHAIDHFFHLCTDLRVTIPETMKYFCITESVALYIQKYVQYRKRKIFFGNTGKFDDLLPTIQKHKTEKYLVPMSDVHNDDIKHLLDKSGESYRIGGHDVQYIPVLFRPRGKILDGRQDNAQRSKEFMGHIREELKSCLIYLLYLLTVHLMEFNPPFHPVTRPYEPEDKP